MLGYSPCSKCPYDNNDGEDNNHDDGNGLTIKTPTSMNDQLNTQKSVLTHLNFVVQLETDSTESLCAAGVKLNQNNNDYQKHFR